MKKVTRWMRIFHRWTSIPFTISALIVVAYWAIQGPETALPELIRVLTLALIVLLALSGLFMLVQYYVSKFRRAPKVKIARSRKAEE